MYSASYISCENVIVTSHYMLIHQLKHCSCVK